MRPTPMLHREACRPTRRLLILGASGSVGTTTVSYLRERDDISLEAISVHSSTQRLEELLSAHDSIRLAAISDERAFVRAETTGLMQRHPHVKFFRGESGLIELTKAAADLGVDTALTAVVGACGIEATVAALDASMKVALANKETLVTAGPAIRARMRRLTASSAQASILPVDSEHNALFQLLHGVPADHLRRLILTASGGPFRDLSPEEIANVSKSEVLNHPTWKMGPKISVDSAGMMNKGLEIIEAHFLFDVPYDQLSACIHRKSVVHGMLETTDGGFLLAASAPDMVFPIAHTLSYPDAVPRSHRSALRPSQWPDLAFEEVDERRYPGYQLCLEAGRVGGTAPAVLNAANEVAVELLLEDRLRFSEISPFVARVLESVPAIQGEDLGLFLEADAQARREARSLSARGPVARS